MSVCRVNALSEPFSPCSAPHVHVYLSSLFTICSTALPSCVVVFGSGEKLLLWQRCGPRKQQQLVRLMPALPSVTAYVRSTHNVPEVYGRGHAAHGRMCVCRNSFAKYLTVFLLYQSPKPSNEEKRRNVRLPWLLCSVHAMTGWTDGRTNDGQPIYLPNANSLSFLISHVSTRLDVGMCVLDPNAFRLIVICCGAHIHIPFNSRVNHFAYDRRVLLLLPWSLSQMANGEWCCVDWAVVTKCFSR